MLKDTTTTLQSLIEQAVTSHQELVEKEQREAKEKKDREKEVAANDLKTHLEPALSDEFRSQIKLIYDHLDHGRGGGFNTFAFFFFLEEDWHIIRGASARGIHWNVETRKPGNYHYTIATKLKDVPSEQLQHLLLIEMGKRQREVEQEKENRRTHKQEQEAILRQQEEQERNYREQREKLKEEEREVEAIRHAQAKEVHDRLTIKWEEAKAKAQQELWQWPEGVAINIYRVEYCRGSYNNSAPDEDERDAEFDYADGWTKTYELDRGGWITIPPFYEYLSSEKTTTPRTIKLIPYIHCPIFECHTITSIEEVPSGLRRDVEFSVPGIAHAFDRNGEVILTECDDSSECHRYWHREAIGARPVEWIIDLIDQAAQAQAQEK